MVARGKKRELDVDALELPKDDQRTDTTTRAGVAMYLAGYGWDFIAERQGYSSPKAAQVAVEKFIGSTYEATDLLAARQKSLARKERLVQSLWSDATNPFELDEDGRRTNRRNENHLPAVDRTIRVLEGLDRLQGLNAPTMVEVYRPGADEFLDTVRVLKEKVLEEIPSEGNIFDGDVVDAEVVE